MISAFIDGTPVVEVVLDAPATADDVAHAYRLLLGREAGAAEIAPRLGQTLETLLRDLAGSAEHKAAVRAPLLAGAAFGTERFRAPPAASDAAWVEALTPGVRAGGQEAASWRTLLRRLRVGLGLDAPPSTPPASALAGDWGAQAVRADVAHAYRLLFDREPESDAAADGWLGQPVLSLVAGLLGSDEFRLGTIEGVVNGRLAEPDALPIAVVGWLRGRFGLDLPAYARREVALAHLMEAPPVAQALAGARLGWSPAAAIEHLLADAALEAARREGPLAIDRIQALSRNVEIQRLQDVELASGGVRFTSEDPAVVFRLDAQAAAAPVVELAFSLGGGRSAAPAVLYVDGGEGFGEAGRLDLPHEGRRVRHALVLRPERVRALRWDPDNQPGEAGLPAISARALAGAELQARLAMLSPEELFGAGDVASPATALAGLSRQLTLRAYGGGGGVDYAGWIAAHEPAPREAQRVWAAELAALADTPRIAVLVPLYDTPAPLLRAMIESVLNQVYPHWELCLADDASPSPHVREMVERYQAQDPRIRAVFRERNGHISEASNSALELVTADWVALLDHDDVLTPDALLAVAGEIGRHPQARFIYSDEDKLDAQETRNTPFFKPDFSPELLRSMNYLNHLSVHRTQAIREAGGWRKGYEGSQDYDLNLRTLERLDPALVRHIPRVLYHWRAVEGSTALAVGEKSYAVEAGLRALAEHLERMGWNAQAEMVPELPFYRVRYGLPDPAPLVSIVIPTRDRADLLAMCVDSVLERTDYPNYEILIADNGSEEPETFALFERLCADPRVRVVAAPGPFNYSRINNAVVRESAGELVCLLNNDIEVITPGWLSEMAAWALQPRIGCVGAKLYYPDDTIQHAGVILGIGGVAGHSHKTFAREHPGYFSRLMLAHDVSAVTGACLVVRRAVWDEVEGLDEHLTVAFNDVDFCLRVRAAGHRNLFTPFAELYHHESPSRGQEDSPEKIARFGREIAHMTDRWGEALANDPFYSPNLTLKHEDFTFR